MKNKFKGIVFLLSLLTLITSFQIVSYANELNEFDSDENAIISHYENRNRVSTANIKHTYGYNRRLVSVSSGEMEKLLWGQTTCIDSNGNTLNTYTRVRYENRFGTGAIYHDSGRIWDSADGKINGVSYAQATAWIKDDITTIYKVAHTYYGH